MKNSVLLTISSLLTILLLILHLSTEIALGLESGGLQNITVMVIVVVWLSGTLLLYSRRCQGPTHPLQFVPIHPLQL